MTQLKQNEMFADIKRCSGALVFLLAFLFTVSYAAGASAASIQEVANYKGKDREQFLIDGAKKEGMLAMYSSISAKDSNPLVTAFKKKYPFIKVDLFAGRGEDVATRFITEQKGGNYTADTFDSPTIITEQLRREGLLIPYYTPARDFYPKDNMDPEGIWIPIYYNILTFVYNPTEIKEPPQKWEDLLDAKWKGKMALENSDEIWLINLWKLWGEAKARDYFTRMGQQKLKIIRGHSRMMQSMVMGEIASTPTQYLHQAIAEKKKGAPIDFVLMDPMPSSPEGICLAKNSKHPHAAMLLIDFTSSKEGQALLYKRGRNVAYPGMDPHLQTAKLLIDDAKLSLDNFEKWQKQYKDLLINPNMQR